MSQLPFTLIPPQQPWVDPKTGKPTIAFFRFMNSLFLATGQGQGQDLVFTNIAQDFTAEQTFSGGIDVTGTASIATLELPGATSGETTLKAAAIASGTITFPAATDTVALLTTTQTVTAKTIASTANSLDVKQVAGSATNDLANAGNLGEFISSTVLLAGAVSLSSGSPADITTIALTPGDWDVWGSVSFVPATLTSVSSIAAWISATSATFPTRPNGGAFAQIQATLTTADEQTLPAGMTRLSLAAPTTISLSAQAAFATSTMTAYGFLGARRRR